MLSELTHCFPFWCKILLHSTPLTMIPPCTHFFSSLKERRSIWSNRRQNPLMCCILNILRFCFVCPPTVMKHNAETQIVTVKYRSDDVSGFSYCRQRDFGPPYQNNPPAKKIHHTTSVSDFNWSERARFSNHISVEFSQYLRMAFWKPRWLGSLINLWDTGGRAGGPPPSAPPLGALVYRCKDVPGRPLRPVQSVGYFFLAAIRNKEYVNRPLRVCHTFHDIFHKPHPVSKKKPPPQ